MTQSPQPGEILSGESAKLLKAGDVLMLTRVGVGRPVIFKDTWATGRGSPGIRHEGGSEYARFYTFIGRPDQDGWMHAPEGGWKENPVPGRSVDYQTCHGYDGSVYLSEHLVWPDIIAFRLAAPSVERKPLTPIDYLAEALSPPKPDVAGARERLAGEVDFWNRRNKTDRTIEVSLADLRLTLSAYDRQGEALEQIELCCGQGDTGGARQIAREALAARARQGGRS